MPPSRILWPLLALASALGAFAAMRCLFPRPSTAPATTAEKASPLSSALDATCETADPLLRRVRFMELLQQAAPADLRRAFQDRRTTQSEKQLIAQRWAETDAPGLFAFLKSLDRFTWERERDSLWSARQILFSLWAGQDPDAALAACDSVGTRREFREARWEIVKALLATDPARAFAAGGRGLAQQESGGMSLPDTLWKKDPAAFLKAAAEGPASAFKNEELRQVTVDAFSALAGQDPAAATAWLSARPWDQQRRLWPLAAAALAGKNPDAARAWFAATPPSPEREKAGAEMVRFLARQDPEAALAWLQDNLQSGRTAAFANLASVLVEKGPDSATRLLDAMPPGAQHDAVTTTIATEWADEDFKAALTWTLSLPAEDPGRNRALRGMTSQWVRADLTGAAAYVQSHSTEPVSRELLYQVAMNLAETDLPAGVNWAASLPPEPQEAAYVQMYVQATSMETLPDLISGLEKLPHDRQEAIAAKIARTLATTTHGSLERQAQMTHSLSSLPVSLRPAARAAIEARVPAGDQRTAALEALK